MTRLIRWRNAPIQVQRVAIIEGNGNRIVNQCRFLVGRQQCRIIEIINFLFDIDQYKAPVHVRSQWYNGQDFMALCSPTRIEDKKFQVVGLAV